MLKRCTIIPSYFTINHNHRFKQYSNDIFTVIQEDPLTITNGPLTLICTEHDIRRLALSREITYKQALLKNSLSWYLTNGRRCVIINTYSAKQEDIPAPKIEKREKMTVWGPRAYKTPTTNRIIFILFSLIFAVGTKCSKREIVF